MNSIRYCWKSVDFWECSECGATATKNVEECPNCGMLERMLYAGEWPAGGYTKWFESSDCPVCGSAVEPVGIAGSQGRLRCTKCGFEGVRITDDIPL